MNPTFALIGKLPPLKRKKSPVAACLVGLALGSIGLGLYFRSFLDFLAPLVILVFVITFSGSPAAGWLLGALLTSAYGFFRAVDSNARLATSPVRTEAGPSS
jgi:hypothetical protein